MSAVPSLEDLARRHLKPRLSPAAWSRLRRVSGRRDLPAPASPRTPWQARRERLLGMTLTELAQEFHTDKWGIHRYTPHYERHLEHLKNRRFTLLEIGIGGAAHDGVGGASLKMWKWFFPKAEIVGLDIYDKSFVDGPRIHSVLGSQTDPEVLHGIVETYGAPLVVIDDGSHQSTHVRETFRLLFPLLPDGAIYAIEDTQTSYWPQWDGDLDRASTRTTMALVKDLVDGLNYEEFLDEDYEPTYSDRHVVAVHCYHNLVILEKGTNAEGTSKASTLARVAREGLDS